jgi:hypothetical protein
LYPKHAKALEIARLPVPSSNPTLRESIEGINKKKLQVEREDVAIHHPSLLAGKDENVIGKYQFSFAKVTVKHEIKAYSCPNQAPLRDKYGLKWT